MANTLRGFSQHAACCYQLATSSTYHYQFCSFLNLKNDLYDLLNLNLVTAVMSVTGYSLERILSGLGHKIFNPKILIEENDYSDINYGFTLRKMAFCDISEILRCSFSFRLKSRIL